MRRLELNNPILFIVRVHNPPKTGGEVYNQAVMSAFRRHGYDLVQTQPEYLPPRISGGLRYNIYLALLLLKRNFDSVIINSDFSCRLSPFLLIASFLFRIRVITLAYHFYEVENKFTGMFRHLYQWGEKCGLMVSNKVITISAFTSKILQTKGIDSDRIIIIPPASEMPKQPWKNRDGNSKSISLLFVGYCSKRKGLEYLLQAISRIRTIDITLDIAGDIDIEPCYVKNLVNLIKSLEINNKVRFRGLVSPEQLKQLYESADIFVLPSILEGYGISLLEAARFGLPIIGTKCGAIPELISDRENGLLVPPADPEALTKAILEIISNQDLRCRIARRAWEESMDEYSWETVGDNFVKALEFI